MRTTLSLSKARDDAKSIPEREKLNRKKKAYEARNVDGDDKKRGGGVEVMEEMEMFMFVPVLI
jgi:hypothetical protein